jgi:hypothetical protein
MVRAIGILLAALLVPRRYREVQTDEKSGVVARSGGAVLTRAPPS